MRSATSTAASTVHPSTNTDKVASMRCSASSSSPKLHSTVAAVFVAVLGGRPIRCPMHRGFAPAERAKQQVAAPVRAAASSMARETVNEPADLHDGNDVVVGQGEAVADRLSPIDEQLHRRQRRQLVGRLGSDNAGTASAPTGYSRSAPRRSTVRLVAISTPGQCARSSSTEARHRRSVPGCPARAGPGRPRTGR